MCNDNLKALKSVSSLSPLSRPPSSTHSRPAATPTHHRPAPSQQQQQQRAAAAAILPKKPILIVDINLSDYLKELMFVGFAASTDGSTELHSIENWSFRTYGFGPVRHPHNVSDNTVIVKPPII
ncbi:hypothetical protein H5410_028356 [Solanum commersonii]|uniref:Legume lectin domain-containing protein n=1 Tax=Solanum commersonii TaxID=4109 RepID=A0A9J5Z4K7_SOLCO|nr:hypothetical protein H5410_028356 [Solanum commersonii]